MIKLDFFILGRCRKDGKKNAQGQDDRGSLEHDHLSVDSFRLKYSIHRPMANQRRGSVIVNNRRPLQTDGRFRLPRDGGKDFVSRLPVPILRSSGFRSGEDFPPPFMRIFGGLSKNRAVPELLTPA
jgi:hypothetical protein